MAPSVPEATSSALPTLLLLADGRFPAGGHAHSGGFEAAATLEGIDDVAGVEAYVQGRLHTTGLVAASFAAAACAAVANAGHDDADLGLRDLDEELDARTPSPALRAASRQLGRQLLRAGRAVWPGRTLEELAAHPGGFHQPVALGAVAAAAGLDPGAAALAAAHDAVIGPATAGVRLLGLDPFAIHALLARLSTQIDDVAARGADNAGLAPAELPACSTPLTDIAAEVHATWEVRLFAS